MKIDIAHPARKTDTFRTNAIASMFNTDTPESRAFTLSADLPIEGDDWSVGVIVGPSGSGKSSIGRRIFGPRAVYQPRGWPKDAAIVDAIAPDRPMVEVTGALAAVGLGSVPAWLRPYSVLSNGERFRADLARVVIDRPWRIVIDEFSSVVDRQIARIGAMAFAKAWRRGAGQAVLLTCHYDVLDWLQPDWVFDTATGRFAGRWLRRRPRFDLDIFETDWSWWPTFEPHHYLKLPNMIASRCYVGFIDGAPIAHAAVSPRAGLVEVRVGRLVVMPEWQGVGVGTRFLTEVAHLWLDGRNRFERPLTTLINTGHPGLAAALRARPGWTQVSASLFGSNKAKSRRTIGEWRATLKGPVNHGVGAIGYGGHFRAIQGFRYVGHEVR
ncbi:MAG: GNAT family N-acetyltransferase [Thalassobaculaceae bacterium]